MLTRRLLIATFGGVTVAAPAQGIAQNAWGRAGEQAVALVKVTTDQLVAIVSSEEPPHQKRRRLKEVFEAYVDVDDIARFCIGRYWRLATPDQRRVYMTLFPDLLMTAITSHFSEYKGVRVIMGPVRTSADTEIVITTIERPNKPLTQIEWVIAASTGRPRIIDLLSQGTSLRLTEGADFTAYLSRHEHNVDEFIGAMRQQIARNQ